jgi:mRNA-degrading endonuclease toxin of MazEF toxin-antitoxin module
LNSETEVLVGSGGDIILGPLNGSNVVITSSDALSSATLNVNNVSRDFSIKTEHNGQDIDIVPGSGNVYIWQNNASSKANATVIGVDNTGNVTLTTPADIKLTPGSTKVNITGSVSCDAVTFADSNCEVTYGTTNLELVSGAGVFNVRQGGTMGLIYDTQFNPVFRGKGQGTLASTGEPQAVISCPGIQSNDIILVTAQYNSANGKPDGSLIVLAVTPASGTFDVGSTNNTDNNVTFSWVVFPSS